jgi:hypothetical protein
MKRTVDLPELKYSVRGGEIFLGKNCVNYPDRFRVGRIDGLKVEKLKVNSNLIREHQMGTNGRVEYLYARVKLKHLKTEKRPSPEMVKRRKVMGSVGDDTGHVIAKNLGGPGDEAFNFFPQRMNINRGAWRVEETKVVNALKNGEAKYVDIKLNFNYNDQLATRPNSFIVDFEYFKTSGRWFKSGKSIGGYTIELINRK